MNNKINFFL